MRGEKDSEIYAVVDPQLRVINASHRHRRKEAEWTETRGVLFEAWSGKLSEYL